MSITLNHGMPPHRAHQREYERPLVDVVRREHEVVIAVELPGVQEEDILVCFTYDGLEIWATGEHNYYRYIPLADHSVRGAHAVFRRGILELRIPVEVHHAVA